MAVDVPQAAAVAGGLTGSILPIILLGLLVLPPVETVSAQATGDDDSSYRARVSAGRVKLFESVADFADSEFAVNTSSGEAVLAAGEARWVTIVAAAPSPTGAISIRAVEGAIAAVASAVVPTRAQIEAAVGGKVYAILGDIMFYRSADTVVTHRVSNARRPAYTDDAYKTSASAAQDSQASLGLEYFGVVPLHIQLAALSALTAGDIAYEFEAPALPFGGLIGQLEYVPSIAGAGSSASVTLRPNVTNPGATIAACDGDDLAIAVADATVGNTLSNARAPKSYTTDPYFKPGARLSIELQAKANSYSAGEGTLLIHVWKCVQPGA